MMKSAGGRGRKPDKGRLCGAQYQYRDLRCVEEKVRWDGKQRSQEAERVGGRKLAAQAVGGRQAVQIHILKEVNAKKW